MNEYAAFLATKRMVAPSAGIEVDPGKLHRALKPFQRDSVLWALRKGRAALWHNTGLGKTLEALVFCQHAADRSLILAPLAVARQTVQEGAKWGIPVTYARSQTQAAPHGITITNYEMADRFDWSTFGAVVLDESSCLSDETTKRRNLLTDLARVVPMRLCCTATPAPNDVAEIGNHAEFLGILAAAEMRAAFFVNEERMREWRLKGHARDSFYRWLASWAMALTKPSDLGYDDDGYDLPPLTISAEITPADYVPEGQLFAVGLKGITERSQVRRETLTARVERAAALIAAEPDEQWLAWVGLNEEGRQLARLVPGAVVVEGSQDGDHKAEMLWKFAQGEIRVLITKDRIAGLGLNLQRCARQVFVGLGDSYQFYYQSIRRSWRYGQERPVHVHIVLSDLEEAIYHNVLRKEREAKALMQSLVEHAAAYEREELSATSARVTYEPGTVLRLPAWLQPKREGVA